MQENTSLRNKNLLYCPVCGNEGVNTVLGEVKDTGEFEVLRFHKGSTKISGTDFSVKCGRCGEEVFYRRQK